MTIEVCPLAADWGNWADWAAVAVAIAGTIAVLSLGVRTNALGRAANGIALESRRSADASDRERAAVAKAERELLLIYLSGEVAGAASRLGGLRNEVNDAAIAQRAKVDEAFARTLLARLAVEKFPRTEECIPRIHLVGNPEAALLVRVVGTVRAVADTIPAPGSWLPEFGPMFLAILQQLLNTLVPELERVGAACRQAAVDSGIPIGTISEKSFRESMGISVGADDA